MLPCWARPSLPHSGICPQRKGVQVEHGSTPAVDGQRDAQDPNEVHHNASFSLWGGGGENSNIRSSSSQGPCYKRASRKRRQLQPQQTPPPGLPLISPSSLPQTPPAQPLTCPWKSSRSASFYERLVLVPAPLSGLRGSHGQPTWAASLAPLQGWTSCSFISSTILCN